MRELEGKQRSTQNEQIPLGHPSVLTKPPAQNDPSSKKLDGVTPAPVRNFSRKLGAESRNSSSDAMKWPSSGWSNKVDEDELSPSTSTSAMNGLQGGDGVDRYDWAIHWARVTARTAEERAKLPSATDPQQRTAPTAKDEPCYASLDEFSRKVDLASAAGYSSNSRRRRSTKASERPGSVSGESNTTVVGSSLRDNKRDPMETPSHKYMADWDFGFAAATMRTTPGPNNNSSGPWI